MTCNMNPSALDGFVDNQLSSRERLELNAHVMSCNECQSRIEQLKQSKAQLAELTPPPMSLDFEAKLNAKIDAYEQSQDTAKDAKVVPLHRRFRLPLQAVAASVALTIAVLSRMMWSYGPIDDDYLVLDGSIPLIEVDVPSNANSISDSVDGTVLWSDEDIDSFDRFTQVNDGFSQDSCGSTAGDKGCNLGPAVQVSSLTISSSI